ncbi:MAG: hypothetical protein S4CHLAM7_08980 [Chlamydiae bacterium]|nr:hypothetical protein [Chlamydiota bacterium]
MTQPVYSSQDMPTYQIVVTALPAEDNSPPPSYSADVVNDPKKQKEYKSKKLSNELFFDFRLGASLLIAKVNPLVYICGAAFGVGKPLCERYFKQIVPKNLQVDTNQKDFGKLKMEDKLAYVLVGLLGPYFVALSIQNTHPLLSMGIVGFNGYQLWEEITQRLIRWSHIG